MCQYQHYSNYMYVCIETALLFNSVSVAALNHRQLASLGRSLANKNVYPLILVHNWSIRHQLSRTCTHRHIHVCTRKHNSNGCIYVIGRIGAHGAMCISDMIIWLCALHAKATEDTHEVLFALDHIVHAVIKINVPIIIYPQHCSISCGCMW